MAKKFNLLEIFKNFLLEETLENQKILLMVSGGVDSTTMFDIAKKCVLPQNIAVFHLDHNARENSAKDLVFVQNICAKSKIKFYSALLPPCQGGMPEGQGGLSKNKENFWRKKRQVLSQKAAKNFGAKRILTAHHATDLVETMIFRLVKGAGVSGLSPFDITTKPFWRVPKTEILAYAQKNELEWHEDPSNQNMDFERNLIRNRVLPELRKITPNLEKVFTHESVIFAEIQDFLEKSIKSYSGDFPQEIELQKFIDFPPILQKEFLRKIAGISSFADLEDALKWLKNNPKGNSFKKLGNSVLHFKNKKICWEI